LIDLIPPFSFCFLETCAPTPKQLQGGGYPPQQRPPYQPAVSPTVAGAWVPMAVAFGEGAVQDTDGRQWEYVGTDGQAHGPFGNLDLCEL